MNAQKASNGRAGEIVAAVYDRRTTPGVASALRADQAAFGLPPNPQARRSGNPAKISATALRLFDFSLQPSAARLSSPKSFSLSPKGLLQSRLMKVNEG